jgi:hypothetical protein
MLILTNVYVLTVNNVSDVKSNAIAPNSQIALSYEVVSNILDYGWTWKMPNLFLFPTLNPCAEYADQGINWKANNFVDTSWDAAGGPWYYEDAPLPACAGTASKDIFWNENMVTYLIRSEKFNYRAPTNASAMSLRIRHLIDDGAIVYLNGTEMFRYNMPSNVTVTCNTYASGLVGNANCLTLTIPWATNRFLTTGNVLAAEMHQNATFEFDLAFGMDLDAVYLITPRFTPAYTNRPTLYLERAVNEITLSWTNAAAGYFLDHADKITGPWLEAQPFMSNPFTVSTDKAARFYRLRK